MNLNVCLRQLKDVYLFNRTIFNNLKTTILGMQKIKSSVCFKKIQIIKMNFVKSILYETSLIAKVVIIDIKQII